MTLSFTQQINGKPNGFVEKILVGLYKNQIIPISKLCELCREPGNPMPAEYYFIDSAREVISGVNPKIHTIREDKSGRWRAGMDIHPVINNRTPNRFQFAPIVKCLSTQIFQTNNRFGHASFEVIIDGKIFAQKHYGNDEDVNPVGLHQLAINDGFDSVEDFINYFPNYTGKIIHWTDLKY